MKHLEIEVQRESKITGLNAPKFLEVEDSREPTLSGSQTNLSIQKRTDSKITLYNLQPQSIIIQRRNDTTATVYV